MSKSAPDLATIVSRGATRPFRKVLVWSVLLILVGGTLWYFLGRKKDAEAAPEFLTEEATKGRISLVVTASGNLEPTNQIVIGSELSGTVKEIYVDTNDPVKKGDKLLLLDTEKLEQQTQRSRASLLAAKARVSQAKATLVETEASLARQEELLRLSDGKTPSRATMETSRAAVARAQADLESAEANVGAAQAEVGAFESDLQRALIRSPVDGVVLARTIEVGQTVAASFTAPTLFTIAEDLKEMKLVVAVSEADIGRVASGQPATFSVDAWPGRTYSAEVRKVAFGSAALAAAAGSNTSTATTAGVVTYDTELVVLNEDLSLRPGMTATVDISIEDKQDILVVPNAALRFDPEYALSIGKEDDSKRTIVQSLSPGGGRRWRGPAPRKPGSSDGTPRVWTLKDGQAVEIEVKPGITDGRVTEILGDSLKPGTPVIISIKPTATP
ncbi:MAG: efflux RND transporter periplasmic adaptor subunit [Akkermansiaceae bacterium]|jgi:HlyD family secretion protein|nr:efflux RND transporter periplasmic adaptor subunit [Akkermansiaceae bacterium]